MKSNTTKIWITSPNKKFMDMVRFLKYYHGSEFEHEISELIRKEFQRVITQEQDNKDLEFFKNS